MIVISAEFDLADASTMPQALEVAIPLQQATRDDEPGCLAYVFGPDPCVAGRIQVYELWEDEASLAAHFQHDNYRNMAMGLGQVGIAGAASFKYRVTARERVYDESHTARAYFFDSEVQVPEEAIVIAGTIDLNDPSMLEDLLKESVPYQMASREGEAGCRAYVFYSDPCVEGRIQVFERWDDQGALAPHFDHKNYFDMGGLLRSAGGTSDHYKYRCDLIEPVYDDTRTARADFFTAS